ncbi:hypothetical protein JL721_12408 [Aureococcus anophagefferens]|nr:hypothetical protein JL721_12408 [Aureococcus anophagefferens]
MFDYEINAYLASLGRRLATYEDLDDAEAAIQAMIEGYYGLNETAEATEICGGFSVDVSVVYYPTPAPTSAPPSPPPSPAPSTATPSTAAPSSSRPTYAPTALPGNPTRPPAAATPPTPVGSATARPAPDPRPATCVPAPRPSAPPTTAAPSAAPAAPVEFAVVVDFGLSDDSVDSCGDSKLELHDGMKINRKFFAAALGLSTDAVETIDAYLASLGRRLATYDHLGDTAAMIQARIEEYYGLNETSEATEACGGLSVDVAVVYYPTPDPTPAPTDDVDDEIDTASLELPIWCTSMGSPVEAKGVDEEVKDADETAAPIVEVFPELTEPKERDGYAPRMVYIDGESRVEAKGVDEEVKDADEAAAPIVEVFPELTEPRSATALRANAATTSSNFSSALRAGSELAATRRRMDS